MIGHDLGLNYPKPAVSCQIVASLSKERKTLGSSTWHEDCGVVWVAFRIMCVAMAASPYPQAKSVIRNTIPIHPTVTSLVEYSFDASATNQCPFLVSRFHVG